MLFNVIHELDDRRCVPQSSPEQVALSLCPELKLLAPVEDEGGESKVCPPHHPAWAAESDLEPTPHLKALGLDDELLLGREPPPLDGHEAEATRKMPKIPPSQPELR
jgi:hypothetical protein